MSTLEELLQESAARHQHLCPRQVLGVRMGMLAAQLLNLPLPQQDKRLITIVETVGCAIDGIAVATGCWVGRRTMRVLDFGKVAATFIDTETGKAVRIVPSAVSRLQAPNYAPAAKNRWEAYLLGYQCMPDEQLLEYRWVELAFPIEQLLGKDGYRVNCEICGEEIINKQEVIREESILCRSCAGECYYQPILSPPCNDLEFLQDHSKLP